MDFWKRKLSYKEEKKRKIDRLEHCKKVYEEKTGKKGVGIEDFEYYIYFK